MILETHRCRSASGKPRLYRKTLEDIARKIRLEDQKILAWPGWRSYLEGSQPLTLE